MFNLHVVILPVDNASDMGSAQDQADNGKYGYCYSN